MMILIILALSGFLIWYDWYRIKRFRRIPLFVGLFLSLILALINPKIGSLGTHKKLAIVTDSLSKNTRLELNKADSVVVMFSTNSIFAYKKIYDLASIPSGEYDSLLIYGAGFSEEEIISLPNIPVRRIASKPSGITEIKAKKLLHEGESWQVEITLQNPDKNDLELRILKKGQVVEKRISKNENQKENFILFPENGINEYEIELIENNKSIKIQIGVQVVPNRKLNYLILERLVGFEAKYLVNQLAKEGNSIWWRRQTSKDVFNSQQINTGNQQKFEFSRSLLKGKDVLICDWQALKELSANELGWVKNYVEKGGNLTLSESIRSEYLPVAKSLGLDFSQFEQETVLGMEIIPQWEFKKDTLANFLTIWNTTFTLENSKSVIFTSSGKVFVWKVNVKKGRVLFHSFEATYPWIIQGKESFYTEFWNYLHKQIELENDFPIQFSDYLVGGNTRTQISSNQQFILNDLFKIEKGNTSILFDSSGWKQFKSEENNSVYMLLVQAKSAIKTIDYAQRYQATSRYLNHLKPAAPNSLSLKWFIYLGFAFVFWIALMIESRF